MPNTTHPMLRLLELTDLSVFLAHSNFQFFTKLETALIADVKSVVDFGEAEATLYKPISDTNDLFQEQTKILRAMIGGWSCSVMEPMLDSINQYSEDENLTIYFDGYLHDAKLSFDNIDEFVNSLDNEDVEGVKAILADWSNSVELIENAGTLLDNLNNHEALEV